MPQRPAGAPLRVLLAGARPLVLKLERWQAELREGAAAHRAAAEEALRAVVDLGRVTVEGRTLRFELYPPRPALEALREKLAAAVPLVSLQATLEAIPQDVQRPGEEVAVLQQALEGVPGVEVWVHPAATPGDVLAFLQANDVDVLQFAGHGDERGGLYFEDGRGAARRVTPDELASLAGGRVSLLVTGACYSARAASPLFGAGAAGRAALPAAIAVDGDYPIPSRAVQVFAGAFYASLARGRDVGTSFGSGLEAVRADDLVGERPLPDGADRGMPTPWRRFCLYGDGAMSWHPDGARETRVSSLVTSTRHTKLPRTDDLFVGRNANIAATVEALEPPRPGIVEHKPRIVTLHGEGGIGKTRLAGAAAEWLAARGRFEGGIAEVDCEGAGDAVGLAVAILAALGVERTESIPDPPAALEDLLGARSSPRLLLLDNLDTLFAPDGAGQAAAGLHPGILLKRCLTAAPALRILATCRWPLYLGSDENAFAVDPLGREEAEELSSSPSTTRTSERPSLPSIRSSERPTCTASCAPRSECRWPSCWLPAA